MKVRKSDIEKFAKNNSQKAEYTVDGGEFGHGSVDVKTPFEIADYNGDRMALIKSGAHSFNMGYNEDGVGIVALTFVKDKNGRY